MRALLQRVSSARVVVGGETVGVIGPGLLVLLGVRIGDGSAEAEMLARKVADLRIFEDDQGKMNRSVQEISGACLVVSQFTLFADCRKGRRPYFGEAERPELAEALCEQFCAALRRASTSVETGRFGAMMQVELVNEGPVTVLLDTDDLRAPRRG